MVPENNIRGFVVRVLLCAFGLSLGFSILTSKAYLQTNSTKLANANAAPRITPPTPRLTTRISANTSANRITRVANSSLEMMPAPTPTPPANSTIRGRVFYADTGRAVKRASIMLMSEDGEGGPSSAPSALTDNDGNFQMKNVRAGAYYPIINAPGVVSPLAFFDFSLAKSRGGEKEAFQKAFAGFEKIAVDGVSALDVQIPAQRGGAIGGRIMYDDGDAAIGVRVEILRKVEDKFMTVIPNLSTMFSMRTSGVFQTDDRGVYRFSGLPAGEYIVKVTESVSHGEIGGRSSYDPFEGIFSGSSFLTFFYPDALDTKSAQIINVGAGQEIPEINLTIPSRNLYKLEGRTVAAKDKSSVKARIVLTKNGDDDDVFSIFGNGTNREQATITDEDGNWKFKELPKGTYKIVVEPVESESSYQNYLGNYSYANTNANAYRDVPPKPKLAKKSQEIIIEDKDVSEIVVELGYGATISGTASVENSQEMPKSMSIQATSEADKLSVSGIIGNYYDEYYPKQPKTNHDFKLENVIVGKNRLSVQISEEDFYVKSATAGGVDLLGGPFEIKEGETLQNVQIVLAKDTGTLKGEVTGEQKEPVAGAEFTLVPVDAARRRITSFYRTVRTDKDGEFKTKLAPGEYAIVSFDARAAARNQDEFFKWLDAAVKDAQKVKIEAGREETVSIKKSK
ncbi:MAG TPA: carboxypeptidase-like regulatory domain-containing protein [Pyrinomonadaceae bacterium]